jgi:HD-like signal output (HDOD) protein
MIQIIVDTLQTRLQRDEIEVPLLPEVVSKVIRLTQDPESDSEELARLIQSDQPLAGQVMRIASSALYSPNTTLVSLQQAISRLGMRIISDIALAASINSKMFSAPGYNQFIGQQLKYSLHCGVWAKEVARMCRRNVEAAFLSGLLHNIGRIVAIQVILETARNHHVELTKHDVIQLATQFERPFSVKVVEFWKMPKAVCDVVSSFDQYENAASAKDATMIVVAGARMASHCCKVGDEALLPEEALLEDPVFGGLNLYLDDIHTLLEKADMVSSTVEAMSA